LRRGGARGRLAADAAMIATPTLVKASAAVAVVAVAFGLRPQHDGAPQGQARAGVVRADGGLDATTDAEARSMRRATARLGRDLAISARCDARAAPRRFTSCVLPALRRATIAGRFNAMLLRHAAARAPAGACRNYLLRLLAANDAVDDDASWLVSELYGAHRRSRQRRVAGQIALASRMLGRASRAAVTDVCAAGSGGPRA
jgi:hypothetical protein